MKRELPTFIDESVGLFRTNQAREISEQDLRDFAESAWHPYFIIRTANFTARDGDFIIVDGQGSNITITLPDPDMNVRVGVLFRSRTGSENVIVNGITLRNLKQTIILQADGTNWHTINNPEWHFTGIIDDTDAATVTFDLALSDKHRLTLGGNRTLEISNMLNGQPFLLILKQDGTGGRTVTWWSNIKWASGVEPTLTTAVNKADIFSFMKTGTNEYYGFVVGLNF